MQRASTPLPSGQHPQPGGGAAAVHWQRATRRARGLAADRWLTRRPGGGCGGGQMPSVAGCSTASSGLAGAHVTLPRVVSCSGVLPSSSAVWWRHGCPDAASLYTDGCSSIQCSDRTLPFTRQPRLHHTLVIVLTLGFHSQSITSPGPRPCRAAASKSVPDQR